MSTAYETHGRTAQKQRTRNALVDAARTLVQAGDTPTVEAAADGASISRTTAYRYFPNQRALLAEAYPETDRQSLLPHDAPADAETRLGIVVDEFMRMLFDHEAANRTMLRLSLEREPHELVLRKGRGIGWFTEALEPLRPNLGDEGVRRLVFAIRTAIGVEALVWLVDVAGLSRVDAREQMRWAAMALYRAATTEA